MKFRKLASLLLPITLLLFCAGLASCSDAHDDLNARMLKQMREANESLSEICFEKSRNQMNEIEVQTLTGNRKYEFLLQEQLQLTTKVKDVETSFGRMRDAVREEEAIGDSMQQVLLRWGQFQDHLCSKFTNGNTRYSPMFCDSSNQQIDGFDRSLFVSKDAETLLLELEMQRSKVLHAALGITNHLASMFFKGCSWGDSLYLVDYALENPVIAGEDAKIMISIRSSYLNGIHPEFAGSGKTGQNPDQISAILHVKTSPSMIPEGQEFGYASYTATAKVPRADGTQENLHLKGRVKVRRPCPSQK